MGWDVCDELGQVCLRAGSKTSLYAKHPSKDAVTPAAALHCKMHFQLLPSLGLVAPWSRINHPCCQYPVGGAGIPEDLWHISPSRAQPLPAPGFWVAVRALWERQLCCKCLFLGTPGSLTFGDKRITASHRLNSAAALRPHMVR